MARDQLFSVAGGDRPDKPNVMIVLTDGLIKNAEMFKEIEKKIAKQFKVSKKWDFVVAPVGFWLESPHVYMNISKKKKKKEVPEIC